MRRRLLVGVFYFRGGAQIGNVGVHRAPSRLVAQEVLDLVMDVDERLGLSALFVRLVDDVVSELGRHDVRDVAFLHLEGRLVEFRDHHAASEPSERAALLS